MERAGTMIDGAGFSAELGRFRASVLADPALQDALKDIDDLEPFVTRALERADAGGFRLAEAELRAALHDDPLGLRRWSNAPPTGDVPLAGWLPVNIVAANNQICVDWAYFGEGPLAEPFFEDSARRALRRPINRLARYRTPLAELAGLVERQDALPPSGFIFHMSRCGSTLAAQMLASDRRNVVISEAAPLDAVVRLDFGRLPRAPLLSAMVRALGRRRSAVQERYFIKLDSWHTLALPLFRLVFPDVPWVFLYRRPADVLASQMSERGIQTVPGILPPELFGLTAADDRDPADYCARVLRRTCEAAIDPYARGGGLLVNYDELPEAVWTRMLPHFGVDVDTEDRARLAEAAAFDAKAPNMPYAGPAPTKRQALTPEVQATAAHVLGDVYRRLEMLRTGAVYAGIG
ncbi:MAG: hypothetical protein WDN01_09500 [Rhizomicrobium sp.]